MNSKGHNRRDPAWTPESWRAFPARQQPQYPDAQQYEAVLRDIGAFPPLVSVGEVEKLKAQIARAGAGASFILQGGDCAERFIDCRPELIMNRLKILLQMSVILTYGMRRPVVRIGRMAGQYGKPRSQQTEEVNGEIIPTYRGDSVNAFTPEAAARTPDPQRLRLSYFHAAMTLNYVRAIIDGGFADLHHPYHWNLHSIENTRNWPEYRAIVDRILDAINFMEGFGGVRTESLGRIDFYTSHEGLLLGYEEALTRKDPESGRYYNLGAHTLWIGERTRQLDGAHVEYFRGIANPIGVKIGPDCDADEVLALIDALNPENISGRLMLVTRIGAGRVEDRLPRLVQAVRRAHRVVTWCCDPMHGNLITANGNRKTRDFAAIQAELQHCFRIHHEHGSLLAGAHFELTGDDVTECLGGGVALGDADLDKHYETYCDPRLNYAQSLEMAFLIAKLFGREK